MLAPGIMAALPPIEERNGRVRRLWTMLTRPKMTLQGRPYTTNMVKRYSALKDRTLLTPWRPSTCQKKFRRESL